MRTNIFIPLGIGILITAIFMKFAYGFGLNQNIEKLAREKGMIFPGEGKVIQEEYEEVNN